MVDSGFYDGKSVLVTGHTGFKGSWLCRVLLGLGAEVTGYSLEPPTDPSLFALAGLSGDVRDVRGDIRDFDALARAFEGARPDIVFHLAAQPIVLRGYREPRYTYEVNVMGTVNVLECARADSCGSVLNVTTDKVYENREWCWGYREGDALDGHDPYANSKSCSELVTGSYARCYFDGGSAAVSTARAGNVIGGGDFAEDRIIPDCVRAASAGAPIVVRNPESVRPYQHVLEPVFAYLEIAARQHAEPGLAGSYNVGPDDADCLSTGDLVDLFCETWGEGALWEARPDVGAPHESTFLRLDCSKIKSALGWRPRWRIDECIRQTCAFSRVMLGDGDVAAEMDGEIAAYREAAHL